MSALKQNPFLAGFGVVMVLGVGALGYLTYSAADAHSTAATKYEEQARELNRLQTSKPFPNNENLQKFVEQKKSFQDKVNALQEKLAGIKIKVEDISPTAFQDKLRDTVARIATRATEANVTLPTEDKQKFYLGFNVYQGEPPKAAAAPRLYRDLRAIESVLTAIIEAKNVAIKELKREPLKEEQDPKPVTQDKGKNKPGGKAEPENTLIQKDTFTIKFSTTQENFQRILTSIVTSKEQFFIPRYITVKNEQPEPPPKVAVAAAAPPVPVTPPVVDPNNPAATPADPNAAAAAAAAADKPQLQYIFGRETVEVTMDLEIVDVPAPAAADADKTANNRK